MRVPRARHVLRAIEARLMATYGFRMQDSLGLWTHSMSIFGARIMAMYQGDELIAAALTSTRVLRPNAGPFDAITGERCRVRRFSYADRIDREVRARVGRGEKLDALTRRQAA